MRTGIRKPPPLFIRQGPLQVFWFLTNSPLLDHIVFARSGANVMTNKNTYDYLNRLTGKTSALKFNYQYNGANQRARVTLLDGSYWVYGPDGWGHRAAASDGKQKEPEQQAAPLEKDK